MNEIDEGTITVKINGNEYEAQEIPTIIGKKFNFGTKMKIIFQYILNIFKKDELATLDKNKYEYAEWNIPIKCNCFYVIPQKELHDSGYKCLKIIACLENIINKHFTKERIYAAAR